MCDQYLCLINSNVGISFEKKKKISILSSENYFTFKVLITFITLKPKKERKKEINNWKISLNTNLSYFNTECL